MRKSGPLLIALIGMSLAWQAVAAPASCDTGRYQDDGENTVFDTHTLLMWRRCPEGLSGEHCNHGIPLGFTWRQGVTHLSEQNNAKLDGYDDWQIPSTQQLNSLQLESGCQGESTAQWPGGWPNGLFWTRDNEGKLAKTSINLPEFSKTSSNQGAFGLRLWLVRKVEQ